MAFTTKKKRSKQDLIRLEAEIGGTLFGPVPVGGSRQFFNLDPNTWVWFESYQNNQGKTVEAVTRYELMGGKVFKVFNNERTMVTGPELENFANAVKLYMQKVSETIYTQ